MTTNILLAVIQVVIVGVGAPLLVGTLRMLKARLVGRRGQVTERVDVGTRAGGTQQFRSEAFGIRDNELDGYAFDRYADCPPGATLEHAHEKAAIVLDYDRFACMNA